MDLEIPMRTLKGLATQVFSIVKSIHLEDVSEIHSDDISKLKEAAFSMIKAIDEVLKGKNSLREVRHTLRTPVNAIKGYSEICLEDIANTYIITKLKPIPLIANDMLTLIDTLKEEIQNLAPLYQVPKEGTILVVDDVESNRDLLNRLLKRWGYKTHLVSNGKDAVNLLEANTHIDLVLLDIMMPEMDGFDATRAIRAREASFVKTSASSVEPREAPDSETSDSKTNDASRTTHHASSARRIPIIAMTANARQEDQDRCLAAGMDDYLSKPVQAKLLAEALARWVEASITHADTTGDSPPQTEPVKKVA